MGRVERNRELARKRKRRQKLKKLRTQHASAATPAEKAEIEIKVRKISPFATLEQVDSSK